MDGLKTALGTGLAAIVLASHPVRAQEYNPQTYMCNTVGMGWSEPGPNLQGYVVDRGTNSNVFNSSYATSTDPHLYMALRTFQTNNFQINYIDQSGDKIPHSRQFELYITNHPNFNDISARYVNLGGNDLFQITYHPSPVSVECSFLYNTNSDSSQRWVDTNEWKKIDFLFNQKTTNNGIITITTTLRAPKPLPGEISFQPDFFTPLKKNPIPPSNVMIVPSGI